jgi:hypothetical protein
VELKAAVLDLESRPAKKPTDHVAREKARSVLDLEPRHDDDNDD